MSEPLDPTAIAAGPPPPPLPPRSWIPTLLAWGGILGLVGVYLVTRYLAEERRRAGGEDQLSLTVMRMQARYLVGAREALSGMPGYDASTVYTQAKALNTGTIGQRLRFVVLAGDLVGPGEALQQLQALEQLAAGHGVTFRPAQAKARDLLRRLYGDYERLRYDAPSVRPEERVRLVAELGWFGKLALAPRVTADQQALVVAGGAIALPLRLEAPPDPSARAEATEPATRTFAAMLLSLGGACFVGLGGLIGLIVFLVFVAKGKVRSGLECGRGNGGVYGETFALWLAVFTGLSAAAALLPEDWPKLPLAGAAMVLSLVVLGWPVLRGVPWQRVREDVGLTWGRRPAVEPLVGIGTYAMALPLLAVGLLLTFLLTLLERNLMGGNGEVSFAPGGGPAHPIIDDVARGGLGERLVLLVLACLVAPLVEETMFRGVLYRHLREATCRWGAWSFLCSAAVGSFLFAVIHPQGLVAVPVLMALAFGFAIAREWRGTLIPAMVAHGLNNGLVMVVTLLAFGD